MRLEIRVVESAGSPVASRSVLFPVPGMSSMGLPSVTSVEAGIRTAGQSSSAIVKT